MSTIYVVECHECGHREPTLEDNGVCGECGSYDIQFFRVTDCPMMGVRQCHHETHHAGTGKHEMPIPSVEDD